jgi:hypothetical protein
MLISLYSINFSIDCILTLINLFDLFDHIINIIYLHLFFVIYFT